MTNKTYLEPAAELPVQEECDILVVGGGAAGHSAAIAAARAGAKNIILLERYGYMGGDVTGGYVIMVPNLSWYDKSFVRGLQEEWFTRLSKIPGAVTAPGLDQVAAPTRPCFIPGAPSTTASAGTATAAASRPAWCVPSTLSPIS